MPCRMSAILYRNFIKGCVVNIATDETEGRRGEDAIAMCSAMKTATRN
jgi:hypothetical protein